MPATISPNIRKYKLVIFDLDGTLLDSFPWFLSVVNDVAGMHGFRHVAPHEVEEMRGKGSRELVEFLEVPFWKIPAIARDMRRMKTERLKDIPLFAGVDRMLRQFSESGVVTAMVSSDSEDNVRAALGEATQHIAHFDCGASLFGKAAKYKAVLKRTGIPASDAISIGDEVRDAEAAQKAGIAFGAVSWGYATPAALAKTSPALTFASIEDICRLV
ncbi:HAD hydrolase-like protein [Bradyrhizobium sp. SYSU BS000235]|uniref:HAD hydrolase-like protein n=1 Tax=Bradyrhizobium sp. SYSU BS000235 TaxID=3411332 RepID=UPI003C7185D4